MLSSSTYSPPPCTFLVKGDHCSYSAMAYSPSPSMAKGGGSTHFNRTMAASPPPLNKREKRKMAFEERFNEIGQTFARNRNNQYWAQNHSVQAALTYITKQDSYRDRPLDDWPADIRDSVDAIINNNVHRKGNLEAAPRAAQFAASYAEEINRAMETRDAQLTEVVVSLALGAAMSLLLLNHLRIFIMPKSMSSKKTSITSHVLRWKNIHNLSTACASA